MASRTVFFKSIDEANQNRAQDYAAQFDLTLQLSLSRETDFPMEAGGLLFDVNHMGKTPLEQALFVHQLYITALPCPVAVISYDLEPETIEALKAKGITVGRRLEPRLFQQLALAMANNRGAAA